MVTPGSKRRWQLAALGGLAVLSVWWLWPRGSPVATATRAPRKAAAAGPRRGVDPLVAIDLARLDRQAGALLAGKRDIFDFAPSPPPPPPPRPPAPPPTSPPAIVQPDIGGGTRAAAAPPPPLNVKYIGTMQDKREGLKVAILLTDRQEILTGQAGQIVANRLKIISIGLESVDVQDVGAANVRRIALKGN